MASGGGKARGYGLTAELDRKKAAKFNAEDANELFDWMRTILNSAGKPDIANQLLEVKTQDDVKTNLKSGVILCELFNSIKKENNIKKFNTSTMAFKQMENIGKFLKAVEDIGVNKQDLFQTVDLYEGSNIPAVLTGLMAVGRKAGAFDSSLPTFGPKESEENKREFTEAQLRSGNAIIGLQAGSNKGASQAGQNFGKTRAIID